MRPLHTLAYALVAALALTLTPTAAHAQIVDNAGTDFFTTFQPNLSGTGYTVEIHLTSDVATMVTVQYPVNSPTFDTTVAVNPGAVTIVTLPLTAATAWTPNGGSVQNNAVRAFAPDEFVAYTINRRSATTDAALALPVDALNTDYLVQTYIPLFFSQFTLVAPFDGTEVTITPAVNLASGQTAGTPFMITLNRGEAFYGRSAGSGATNDLTGTRIEATRPIAVTNGNQCTNVPPGTSACDHLFEVAQPLASWGDEVIVSPLPNRTGGSVYRVLAAEDNTEVTRNGVVVANLNSGEFHDTGIIPGAHVFASDSDTKPIFVTQYMTGQNAAGASTGDPAMGNMIPSEQYLSAYTFSTIGGSQFAQNFVSVIAEDTDVAAGTILLDGATIPAGSFTSVPGTGFSFAAIEITQGTHTTQSAGVHGITVEGYNNFDSYIYPGGARFEFIFAGEDETLPVCAGSFNGAGDTFNGTATDLLSADPDNTGIFFVNLSGDSENLTLDVDPFTPGDESVSFSVTETTPMGMPRGNGRVVATDGAGNRCRVPVDFSPDVVACPSHLIVSDFMSTGSEFVEITNVGMDPVDFSEATCSLGATYNSVYFSTQPTGVLSAGEPVSIPTGSALRNDFSGLAIVNRDPLTVGTSVLNPGFQEDIVSSIVYLKSGMVYGFYNDDPARIADYCAAYPPARRHPFAESQCSMARRTTALSMKSSVLTVTLAEMMAAARAIDESTPLVFGLEGVAPNPISGTGTLTVALPEAGDVRIALYDAVGREVAVLSEGRLEAGRHEVPVDAASLPTGTYIIRALSATSVATQRVTVIR